LLKTALRKILRNDLAGITFALVLLCTLLTVFTSGFFSAYNLDSIIKDISIFAIVGMSQMVTLGVGQFNLAIGAIGGCAGMVCGALLELMGIPYAIAVIISMAAGYLLGYFQGFLIVKTKINAFIVTLALASVYHGLNMTATENRFFRNIPSSFKAIAKGNLGGVPILLIFVFITMLIFWILFNRTVTGRRILATGVNAKAADYAGIDSGSTIRLAHGLSGLLAALAAVLTISKLGAAQTSIGSTWLLISFAAPILGGTLLSGGKVSIVGTFLGAALMIIITNALVLFGVSSYWFQAFTGGILLLAFTINQIRITMNTGEDRVLIGGGKQFEKTN